MNNNKNVFCKYKVHYSDLWEASSAEEESAEFIFKKKLKTQRNGHEEIEQGRRCRVTDDRAQPGPSILAPPLSPIGYRSKQLTLNSSRNTSGKN